MMFWADRIVGDIEKRFSGSNRKLVVRDEKTLSGRVHVGSMRGAAIHGLVSQILQEKGIDNTFLWEHNDFDPMDDIPVYLDRATYEPHLGKPLYTIPAPTNSTAKNYADHFAQEFQSVIESTGFRPEFYWASDLYLSGRMDDCIRQALVSAEAIRRIQKEVSGADRKEGWLPVSVICPQCGKMSTTDASDFDGTTVMVNCYETKVDWTRGCGFTGRVSPFGGKAKLFWKADWPAKWKTMSVDIEGGGKDHSTKGGSRDVANHISTEVFKYEPPFDMPYEFFLIAGKKMSSSKGRGSSAHEISALMPAKIFRLALLGKDITHAFNFDPEGDTIPVLYDQYDKLAENFRNGTEDDYARLFHSIHVEIPTKENVPIFLLRFSQVAFLVQMPHLDLHEEATRIKGGDLTANEWIEVEERVTYAKRWLELYAPEKFIFKIHSQIPDAALQLSEVQKKALTKLLHSIEAVSSMPSGQDLHHTLHALKDQVSITPAELFSALYITFLGKPYGPKAGWFLSVLDRDFVVTRLRAVVG